MPLTLPPAFSLKSLNGGYDSNLDFNTLADNQTNDAKNADNIRTGSIKESNGYVRFLNTALATTGLRSDTGESGVKVNGHYQMIKAGKLKEEKNDIVGAGPNLWDMTSSTTTTSILMGGLSLNEEARWNFVQLQDPRTSASASDDVIIGANGFNDPIIWNGFESSATLLKDIAGASGVVISKFIAYIKGRVVLANILDETDVDSTSKFRMSGFDSEGSPTPYIFPNEITVGGADKYGPINGVVPLNGNIVILKRNATYTFYLGGGSTVDAETISLVHDFSLQQIDENIGCIAPGTVATVGNTVIFLSEYGVYAFNGEQFQYIGKPIEEDLKNVNFDRKKFAQGVFYRSKNEYWLSIAGSGKLNNTIVFRYDLSTGKWHPPLTGVRANILSQARMGGVDKIISGDHLGYIYELDKGSSNGFEKGYNLTPTTIDNSGAEINFVDAAFPVAGDGVLGLHVYPQSSTNQISVITDATGSQISVSPEFGSSITSESTMIIGGVDSYFRTKDYNLDSPDIDKLYRQVSVRSRNNGDFNFEMNYIVDFNEVSNAGTATFVQYNSSVIIAGGDYPYSGEILEAAGAVSAIEVDFLEADITTDVCGNILDILMPDDVSSTDTLVHHKRIITDVTAIGLNADISIDADITIVGGTSSFFNIYDSENSLLGTAKWGPDNVKLSKKGLRGIPTQSVVGKYIALTFKNNRANEPWEVFGFDMIAKAVGRR